MSLLTDVLDRLTGITVVREKLDTTMQRVEKFGEYVVDHEVRLRMLEGKKLPGKLPAKPKTVRKKK